MLPLVLLTLMTLTLAQGSQAAGNAGPAAVAAGDLTWKVVYDQSATSVDWQNSKLHLPAVRKPTINANRLNKKTLSAIWIGR